LACFRETRYRTLPYVVTRLNVTRDNVNCHPSPLYRTAPARHFVVTMFLTPPTRLLNL